MECMTRKKQRKKKNNQEEERKIFNNKEVFVGGHKEKLLNVPLFF